jgi:hypothetical protein
MMPFKSKAQRRKFAQLLVEGKISDQTFEEWNRETGTKILPERVKESKLTGKKAKRKRPKRKTLPRQKLKATSAERWLTVVNECTDRSEGSESRHSECVLLMLQWYPCCPLANA